MRKTAIIIWWLSFLLVLIISILFQTVFNPRLVDDDGVVLENLDGRRGGYTFKEVEQLFIDLRKPDAFDFYMNEWQLVDTVYPFALAALFWSTIWLACRFWPVWVRRILWLAPMVALVLDLIENHLIRGMLYAFKNANLKAEMAATANTMTLLKWNAYTVNIVFWLILLVVLCIAKWSARNESAIFSAEQTADDETAD